MEEGANQSRGEERRGEERRKRPFPIRGERGELEVGGKQQNQWENLEGASVSN